ncbi:MAG: hypothetical protein KBC84_05530 [Proteobacteria bacterium]|nr:hypothetical protein [Pseudomonadota bacterium]
MEEIKKIVLDNVYDRGSLLSFSRTAKCFEATNKRTHERVLLWQLKEHLFEGSEDAEQFFQRLEKIKNISSNYIIKPELFDIDITGVPYLIQSFYRTNRIINTTGNVNIKYAEKTFYEILEILSLIHAEGVFLGDLNENSFVVGDDARIALSSYLGSIGEKVLEPFSEGEKEIEQYIAPEQRISKITTIQSDVYALGVLCYRLFTGKNICELSESYMLGHDIIKFLPPPSTFQKGLPSWLDRVISNCLIEDINIRYLDAAEILNDIKQFDADKKSSKDDLWTDKNLVVTKQPNKVENKPRQSVKLIKDEKAEKKYQLKWFPILLAIIFGCGGTYFLINLSISKKAEKVEDVCSVLKYVDTAPIEVKTLIFELTSDQVSAARKIEIVNKLASLKDSISSKIVNSIAVCKSHESLQSTAINSLVAALKDSGNNQTLDLFYKWLQNAKNAKKNPADYPLFSLFISVLNFNTSIDEKLANLSEMYAKDSKTALLLAVTLEFDFNKGDYLNLIRTFLAQSSPNVNYENKGIIALILSSNSLLSNFSQVISEEIGKMNDADLLWSITKLTEYQNSALPAVANLAFERNLFSPTQLMILKPIGKIKDKTTENYFVIKSLFQIATDTADQQSLATIGRWYSEDGESVLLASILQLKNDKLVDQAFEILAGRSLQNKIADSLMKWIKTRLWDYRRKLAYPFAALSLSEFVGAAESENAFNQLLPYAVDGTLFNYILEANNLKLIILALDKVGEIIPDDVLIPMLGHQNKSIRIGALKALKGRNEITVLQGILNGFKAEKDEEVKAVYRELHWVTVNR